MFEDDDFDLDLSDPLLDITNGSVSQNPRVNSDKSFQFKCPTNPNRHVNVHPVETEEVANVLTTKGKQIFDNINSKSNVSNEISHKEKEKGRGKVSSLLMSENSQRNTHRFESSPSNSHEDLISKKRRSSDFAGGRQRRFPGPAGVLERQPPLPGDKRPIPLDPEAAGNGDQGQGEREALEEDILGDLDECLVWSRALEDLNPILNSEQITKYNTSWIKKQSSGNIVPYFLCKIVKLDLSTKDPVVVLADKLGTIDGNLHRDVVETCGRDVKVGTVMLVVRAAVLRTVKVDYLNITLHNVVSVYSKSDVQRLQTHSKEDFSNLDSFIQQRSERKPESSGTMNMKPSGGSNRSFPLATSASNSRFPVTSSGSSSRILTESSSNNTRLPSTATSSISRAPSSASNISLRLPSASAASSSGSRLPPASSSSSQMPGLASSQQSSGRSKFTFKSTAATPRPSAALPSVPMLPGSQAPESQAALLQTPAESQHLVASLLSDLDSSDIWADF